MDHEENARVKRRRTKDGFVSTQSQDDLDKQKLADAYETVPTLPVDHVVPITPPRRAAMDEEDDTLRTIPFTVKETPVRRDFSQLESSWVTQPTQIVPPAMPTSSPEPPQSVVQVAASSPVPVPTSASRPIRPASGSVVSRMAPPGTQFRQPAGFRPPTRPNVPLRKPDLVDISSDDEGPIYVKDSDDDDERYNRDLKPTLIKSKSTNSNSADNTQSSFGGTLDQFRHGGKSGSPKGSFSANQDTSRTSDIMANAYGGVSRPARPPQRQNGPAKAQPANVNITLEQISDFYFRSKVERLHNILEHNHSVGACYQALMMKRGNENDAMDYLASLEDVPPEAPIELSDDGNGSPARKSPVKQQKKTAKQQVQTKRTIQDKYAARVGARNAPQADGDKTASPQPAKPRRRLVQGRKHQSSPALSPQKKQPSREQTPLTIDSDSEAASVVIEDDPLVHGKLLDFLNTCTVEGLMDLAQTSKDKAEHVLSQKPFRSLNDVRAVVKEAPSKSGSKRKAKPLAVGDKIVDDCETMWTAFEAVDTLVKECESMGKPVAAAMEKWGVSVYGGGGPNGELDIVNIEDSKSDNSAKDSGIGSSPRSQHSADDTDVLQTPRRNRGVFFPQPVSLAEGVTLKDYQIVGINWLSLLFTRGLSGCILADDMGLGKTCQVISFLAHLRETGISGPHIIVVPSSVLENWLREFERFCPDIAVMPYHAGKNEREELMYNIQETQPEVIVTTYAIAKKPDDRKFFRSLRPTSCIFDEGHMLKNSQSEQYKQLIRIPCKFRLLLTGTPLQNNLGELIALLGFMMPNVFNDHQEELRAIFGMKATTSNEDDQHAALLSAQRISRAKSMMTPFILRRKKHQVLKDIPAKHRHVQYCDMTESQAAKYKAVTDKYKDLVRRRAAGEKTRADENANVMMDLRKAAIHPLLFRRLFTDDRLRKMSRACLGEDEFMNSDPNLVYEDLEWASDIELQRWCAKYATVERFMLEDNPWMDSGKVKALVELLERYRADGDRVLVFSQFVMVLDVLEEVMETIDMKFARLDGSLDINLRQDLIDTFYQDESITVFMLSTKAGGAGINLACANKVIIFDSSFNPQDDIQAENRAHRVGQTREVDVVRLVTRNSVEEQIYRLGQTKLALDEKVAGEALYDDGAAKKAEAAGKKEVERMLAEDLENGDGSLEVGGIMGVCMQG